MARVLYAAVPVLLVADAILVGYAFGIWFLGGW